MWKRVLLTLVLSFVLLLIASVEVRADSTADVTITARGFVCEAPGPFTLTYVSDYEVGISWVKGTGAENTMIRSKYGSAPIDRTDGDLVYYGNGTTTNDTGINLATFDDIYYRAWSEDPSGLWEDIGTIKEVTLMSQGFLFAILTAMAVFFTWFTSRNRNILLTFVTFLMWIGTAMWLFFSSTPPLDISLNWVQFIAWAFFLLAFLPFILRMDVEITSEYRGKRYVTHGQEPKLTPTKYQRYLEKGKRTGWR